MKARIEFLEKENARLKKLLEESDTKMAMTAIEKLKRKNNMEMKLGTSVKGEEIVVLDGNFWDDNIVTIIADISDDKMYTIKLYGADSKVTLEDIREMCETEGYEEGIITVIVDSPLQGVVYKYGNYNDDMWYIHGNTRGYA